MFQIRLFWDGDVFLKCIFPEVLAKETPKIGLPRGRNLNEHPTRPLPSQHPHKAKYEKWIGLDRIWMDLDRLWMGLDWIRIEFGWGCIWTEFEWNWIGFG